MATRNRYTPEQRAAVRSEYERSQTGSLTSYAGMLGSSFGNQVNLLAQLIRDVHQPSLGQYKERLLRRTLSAYIPKRYEVATGFVLFPNPSEPGHPPNSALPNPSTQLDIIVFDAQNYPVIFRDEDFVVVRPESVRSIIEVKGALNQSEIEESVDATIDYAKKWRKYKNYQRLYRLPELNPFGLFIMGLGVGVDDRGYPKTDGSRLREIITNKYKSSLTPEEKLNLPLLDGAYIYNDCAVSRTVVTSEDNFQVGWFTHSGKMLEYEGDVPKRTGDGTIANLIAQIHVHLDTPFNQAFSYVDQAAGVETLPHEHGGLSVFLDGDDAVDLTERETKEVLRWRNI